MKDPMIQHAYDIEIRKKSAQPGEAGSHGWVFGLPPGIKPEQWPLDPWNGYPLMHGFTLLLPEDYRVHGPDIVALSFFGTAPDHNDGGYARGHEALVDLILDPRERRPQDAALVPFWEQARNAHPRMFRMKDILKCGYAAVLLTRSEFEGAFCAPAVVDSHYLARVKPPQWLSLGSAHHHSLRSHEPPIPKAAANRIEFNRAIRWQPRFDPNAGKKPREAFGVDDGSPPGDGGYQPPHYWKNGRMEIQNYRIHPWAEEFGGVHIGGSVDSAQGIPDISPFYIEFSEGFGGHNFGGDGEAQFDFRDMKFDWARG